MENKIKRKILEDLLIQTNELPVDLAKHQGNPLPAKAERVSKCLEMLTPHAKLFNDSFKLRVQEYVTIYNEAVKGNQAMSIKLPSMIKPMGDLVKDTLEKMIIELR